MAATIDQLSERRPRILMVAANPAVSTTLGWPVGFWASELTHPYYEFTEVGYDIEIVSPDGGDLELDALSDPRDPSGYSAHDLISMGFLNTPALVERLKGTSQVDAIDPEAFDALMICGGQSPMFTFRDHLGLRTAIRAFYDAGKPVVALCHGVAALMDITLADGSYLITGRTMTGFANVEEAVADAIVGKQVMPWRIEDVARERGANYVQSGAWKPFAVRDGGLITGQQQYSGAEVARLLIEVLGKR
jgi:putative intracellular protease/amidase